MSYRPVGIYAAMTTPFKKDETLDKEALRTLVDHYVRSGLHGALVLGTAGESGILSDAEKKEIIDIAVDEAKGRFEIIAGTGYPSTKQTIELTKYAKDAGATSALVITPYFYRLSPIGIKDHFVAVARETDFPIILYNVPGFAVNEITPDMIHRFGQEDGIVGIKHSSENIFNIMEIIRLAPKDFSVLCGWDAVFLSALVLGARGGILGSASIAPKLLVELYRAAAVDKNIEKAVELQRRVHFIFRAMFVGTFPSAIKAALNMMGFPGGYVRKPIENLKTTEQASVRFDLERAGVLEELK